MSSLALRPPASFVDPTDRTDLSGRTGAAGLSGVAVAAVAAGRAAFAGRPTTLAIASVFRGGELPAGIAPGVPTGFAALDAAIPGGGWPVAALTEVLCDACGIGEASLWLPALRHLTRSEAWRGRGVLWVNPPHLPYAPALAAAGVDLQALAIVRPSREEDALWAAEQALRSGAAGAVLLWSGIVRGSDSAQRYQRLRRLHLAAVAGGGLGVLFAPSSAATLSTPAALRLVLEAVPVEDAAPAAVPTQRALETQLSVRLAKRRGLAQPVTLHVVPRRLPLRYLAGAGVELAGGAMPGRGATAAPDGAAVRSREFIPAR
jgi:hypothetical protein